MAKDQNNVLKFNLKLLLLLFFVGIEFSSEAQEMHGYVHSNYAGITGIYINPASVITSKTYLDINLVGLHLNLDNNYFYLSKNDYKFKNLLTNSLPKNYDQYSFDSLRLFYERDNLKDQSHLKNGWTQIRIMGPSAMYSIGKQTFGLSTSYRIMGSVNNLPYDLTKFGLKGMEYSPQHNINYKHDIDARFASLALAEVAGSYSRILYNDNRKYLSGGITIKGLFSSGGVFGYLDNIDYVIPDDNDIVFHNANMKIGASLPIDYNNGKFTSDQLFLGRGIGFDIGFTYQEMIGEHSIKYHSYYSDEPYQPYLYRIGVSLLDIGRVKFKKKPIWLEMDDASGIWEGAGTYEYENLNTLFQTISNSFSTEPDSLIRHSDFTISLPTALSVQFDYRINKRIYINTTWVQPLVMSENSVIRPAQIAVTPRFEMHHFEFSMPVVLYNYRHPRIGLSARIHNVIIGTDKLGGFFGFSDFTGLDFYMMVKLQFYKGHYDKKNIKLSSPQ